MKNKSTLVSNMLRAPSCKPYFNNHKVNVHERTEALWDTTFLLNLNTKFYHLLPWGLLEFFTWFKDSQKKYSESEFCGSRFFQKYPKKDALKQFAKEKKPL